MALVVKRAPSSRISSDPLSISRPAGGCYLIGALLTALAVFLGASTRFTGVLGPASPQVIMLLVMGFAALAVPASDLALRALQSLRRRPSDAGARLRTRFVALFALAAVAPAVIVALFFGVLVTRGVDDWFSARVQTVVENSAKVANSYVDEQKTYIGGHIANMAEQLDQAAPTLADTPIAFGHFFSDLTADNGFSGAFLIDRDGRLLSRAQKGASVAFLMPPQSAFKAADEGDVSAFAFESADVFRALYKLPAYSDAYLYIVRPVDRGLFRHLRLTSDSLAAYRVAKANRVRIQAAFALIYLQSVLLVLIGAAWLGMVAASSISSPISRLVEAAGRVSSGDLAARVDVGTDPEEIVVLSRAFNHMTADLQIQQQALKDAHIEAESRRLFTEAVLLGVSAGVVGIDSAGRISAINGQAQKLLGLATSPSPAAALPDVAPELGPILDQARARQGEVETELDVQRGGETRRLRVRVSPSAEGLVLTFDDITRLVAAQRHAAWRDVARRIAHEIKNPLTPIQLSAERLRRKYRAQLSGELETFDRCTETIIRQVGDIGRMVDEFSNFARMPSPTFANADAGDLLREAVFARRIADPEIEIEVCAPTHPIIFSCDARIVQQALMNVLKNAAESIAARRSKEPALQGRITASLLLLDHAVAFVIEDNGVGLPVRERDRLTEPYMTTRERGTGLGLAIVKRILEDHGGHLTLSDRARGLGARVVLSFPLTTPAHSDTLPDDLKVIA
jgi:two-component system nitrogen regulation sensor histidine kinase NtrY